MGNNSCREPPTQVSVDIDDGKRGTLPSVMGPNTRRKIAQETLQAEAQTGSSAVVVTSQERIDGYREESNEDREFRSLRVGQHDAAVGAMSCARMGKTIKTLSWSVAEYSKWMEP